MHNRTLKPIIKQFIRQVHEKYPDKLVKAILFGSYARNDNKPGSDIDIMIVWNGNRMDGWDCLEELAFNILLESKEYISLKVLNTEEFQRMKETENPFLKNILEEGINLI